MTQRPRWLRWANQIQTLASAGLTYSKDAYDRERFESLRSLAAEILADHVAVEHETMHATLRAEPGYITPKVDVRAVVADEHGRILLVRETQDGRWSLPGGWADLGESPSEIAVREVAEEAGYRVRATKLLAILDKAKHDHPPQLWYVYKLFIRCELLGGAATPSLETTAIDWFGPADLPPLSLDRNTPSQLARMFEHVHAPDRPTDFD